MPVRATKLGDKFRVIEQGTGKVALDKTGTAVDKGGHSTIDQANAQAAALNQENKTGGNPKDARLRMKQRRRRGK